MRFVWAERKNRRNILKHGFPFEVAIGAFEDPLCLNIEDPSQFDEQRYWAIGRVRNLKIVLVVYSASERHGEEIIRIISARKATPQERELYEAQS